MNKKSAMNKIFNIISAAAISALLLSGCSEKEPFFTADENDYPRILNTNFPTWTDGVPGVLSSIVRTTPFEFSLVVTPAQHTSVAWYIEDEEVAKGKDIEIQLAVGTYNGKVVATTTAGKSTSRSFQLIVRPLDTDPVVAYVSENRLVAPGGTGIIEGARLGGVAKVLLNGTEAEILSKTDEKIQVSIPTSLSDGEYTVSFKDESGTAYAGCYGVEGGFYYDYTVIVSSKPVVGETTFKGKPGSNITVTGINLQHVQSIAVNGVNAALVSKEFGSIVFTCPSLEPGDYTVTGLDDEGKALGFGNGTSATLTVTNEVIIWEGSHYVDWGTPFDGLKTTLVNYIQVGSIVRGYVSGSGQGCLATSWWRNIYTGESDPNRGDASISGDMVLEYIITQDSIDLISAQDGALFVGTGYTITKVTVE